MVVSASGTSRRNSVRRIIRLNERCSIACLSSGCRGRSALQAIVGANLDLLAILNPLRSSNYQDRSDSSPHRQETDAVDRKIGHVSVHIGRILTQLAQVGGPVSAYCPDRADGANGWRVPAARACVVRPSPSSFERRCVCDGRLYLRYMTRKKDGKVHRYCILCAACGLVVPCHPADGGAGVFWPIWLRGRI